MKSFKYALLFVVLASSVLAVAWALGFANSTNAVEAGGRVIAVIFAVAISFVAIEKFDSLKKTRPDCRNAGSSASAQSNPISNEKERKGKGPQF